MLLTAIIMLLGRAAATNCSQCSVDALCSNNTCVCAPGFTGDGRTCENINECTTQTHTCDINAACTDINGTFGCQCNGDYDGTGFTCHLNSCKRYPLACMGNSICINTRSSFACMCPPGYKYVSNGCAKDTSKARYPLLMFASPAIICIMMILTAVIYFIHQ